jgi:hypothetical protein
MIQPLSSQLPLDLVAPSPHRLCRRSDGGGSLAAAVETVESGRDAAQVLWVSGLVAMIPGCSSKELAFETWRMASDRFGINAERWRYVIARRLSEAEDRGFGPIIGSQIRPNIDKPWRLVDPDQALCKHAEQSCIRWWPKLRNEGKL